jgi:hypothetical protein
MPKYEMTNPPSIHLYRKSLAIVLEDKKAMERYLPLLRAHYRAAGHTATLRELNRVAKCKKDSAVNMLHVLLAKRMFESSGIRPNVPQWQEDGNLWWPFIYVFHKSDSVDIPSTYQLRPELVQALEELDDNLRLV